MRKACSVIAVLLAVAPLATSALSLRREVDTVALATGQTLQPSTSEVTVRDGHGENYPYPGSDYLGLGYDLFKGNPGGDPDTQVDPGWRAPILNVAWSQAAEGLTRDMKFLRPLDGWAIPQYSCQMAQSAREMKSLADYSNTLSVDAEVSAEGGAGGFSGSFSASAGYSSFKRTVEAQESSRFQIRSYCLQYLAALEATPQLAKLVSPLALAHLRELPKGSAGTEEDAGSKRCAEVKSPDGVGIHCFSSEEFAKWRVFFLTFGTHVATEVHLGGKMLVEVTITKENMQRLSDVDVSAAVSASFSAPVASGSVKVAVDVGKSSTNSLDSVEKDVKVIVFGGLPPKDNDLITNEGFGEWSASVREAPMPVRYKLCPLDVCMGVDHMGYTAALALFRDEVALTRGDDALRDSSVLKPGEVLRSGEELKSKRNGYVLRVVTDLLKVDYGNKKEVLSVTTLKLLNAGGSVLWSALSDMGPFGHGCSIQKNCELHLQGDCKLVVRPQGQPTARVWAAVSDCGTPGKLQLEDDGNLVLTDVSGGLVWESGTAGGNKADAVRTKSTEGFD